LGLHGTTADPTVAKDSESLAMTRNGISSSHMLEFWQDNGIRDSQWVADGEDPEEIDLEPFRSERRAVQATEEAGIARTRSTNLTSR